MPSIATRVSKNFQTSNKNHLPQTPTHDLEQNSFSAKITFKYYNVQTLFIHHMHTAFRITELIITECRHVKFPNETEMAKHKKFIELDQTKSLKNIKRHYKNNTKNVLLSLMMLRQQ